MKTKTILGVAAASIVLVAAGYFIATRQQGILQNLLPSGVPQGTAALKVSDITMENTDELTAAIMEMADQELASGDLYADMDLVSLDTAALTDLYNAYDENQL